ncbi:MAG: M50 family metallopeptidase [Acidobacteriota bacterium]
MRAIRSMLCWVFAMEAVVCLWPVPGLVLRWIRVHTGEARAAMLPHVAMNAPMLAAGLIFGATCCACWARRKAARGWGVAASGINLAFAAMTVLLYWYAPWRDNSDRLRTAAAVGAMVAIEAGAGIAGLVVFRRGDPVAPQEAEESTPHLEGDGTHALLDKLVWVAGFAGFVAGMLACRLWGQSQGLPTHGMLPICGEFVAAELAMVAVHELGHALTGKALGMRLRAFVVGPFQWRVRDGRWRFQFRVSDLLATGGAMAVVPTDPQQPRRREIQMIAGGPLASLVAGGMALGLLFEAPHHAWRQEWELLAMFATLSLVAGLVNLLPSQTKNGNYSDGAQIYQLLSEGPWGDYHHAMGIVGATTVTALRPRDYDVAAMERAAAAITQGVRALQLRLLIASHYRDCGQMQEAGEALNAAEDVFRDSAPEIPVEFYATFVFGKAFCQRDAEGAREWWDRMEAKAPTHSTADYWLARAAFLWIEGGREEALEAWEKGNALARRLPKVGAYEAERDRFAQLRRELDGGCEARRPESEMVTAG